jgi:signal transduction histidine kinase
MPPIIIKSLKIKLLLLFFTMNLAVILLAGVFSYQSKKSALKEQVDDSLSIMAVELANKLDMSLNEKFIDTKAIALDFAADWLQNPNYQRDILDRYLTIYPYYERIRFISAQDAETPLEDGAGPPGYSQAWYLPAMSGTATSSDVYVSSVTGRPVMSFAAPVIDQQNKIAGIITADLKLDYLWDIVDRMARENEKNGLTGYAYIINGSGMIIAHPRKELVLRQDIHNAQDYRLREVVPDMVKGRSGTVSYTYDGVDKVAFYTPCKGYGDYKGHGWSLAVTKDYSELFQPMRRLLDIYLVLFAVTSVVALIVSMKLADYLVKPIRALKDGAARIGAGNFNMRIETDAVDEIGDLARAFNRMAETLETRDRQLKEYTWSLAGINRELGRKQEELSQANQFLKKTNDELVRLEKQKAEWSAMITHDIKSPLSTVLSYAEMILDGTVPPAGDELRQAVSGIHASGYKILSLVENYLVSSAIEAGKLRLNLQPLDINELIEDGMSFFKPRAGKKNIALTLNKDEGLPRVRADKVQLDRAISNLLDNALKYSPQGSEVTITTGKDEMGVAVSVTDRGRGISEEDLKDLFVKYSRSKDNARITGTGLGLYISKAVTEAHGGKITVNTRTGEGSTFTIHLPAMES